MRKRTKQQIAAAAEELRVKAEIAADNLRSLPPQENEGLRAFVLRNERDRLWEAFMVLTRVYASRNEDAIEEQGRAFALTVRSILERIDDLNSLGEI